MEAAVFCSYWNRYSGYKFVFPVCSVSAKTTTHALIECQSTVMVFHTVLLLSKELTSQKEKYNQKAHAYGIHWLYQIPYHSQAASLTTWRNGHMKIQLQCQLGGSILQGWGKVLQRL